jgi:transposase
MAMGKRKRQRQEELWVATADLPEAPGHPFYRRLNEVLAAGPGAGDKRPGTGEGRPGFDAFVEGLCRKFYHEELGRPGIPPGVYFRMLLIGYFEGIDSERGIAWRCDDSRTLREFLGYGLTERTPEHSSLSVIRQRIDVETHREVFTWVLELLAERGLLRGKTLGVDATTLEANAAMRSIVRRDTGDAYNDFLTKLAQANGIQTPTREDLARIDKKRKNKASNDDWTNPHDPDAKITKMKDGCTHLAHKAEHAVDLDSGAIVAVTLQGADQGDTTTLGSTVEEAIEQLELAVADSQAKVARPLVQEVVADKGYHSNETTVALSDRNIRTYISEPDRGRRTWTDEKSGEVKAAARAAVYANRRRIRGARGKRLLRKRGELVERPFAHCYETGGMRRTHLRRHGNILKRLLVHVAGFNLALVMRSLFGIGKPRRLQDGLRAALRALLRSMGSPLGVLRAFRTAVFRSWRVLPAPPARILPNAAA